MDYTYDERPDAPIIKVYGRFRFRAASRGRHQHAPGIIYDEEYLGFCCQMTRLLVRPSGDWEYYTVTTQ